MLGVEGESQLLAACCYHDRSGVCTFVLPGGQQDKCSYVGPGS